MDCGQVRELSERAVNAQQPPFAYMVWIPARTFRMGSVFPPRRSQRRTPKLKWVQIDIDAAAKDADHQIGAEERFQLAMARQ
jgi:hypothetical protein